MLTTGGFGPIRLIKNKFSLEHGKVISKEEKIVQEQSVLDIKSHLGDLHKYEIVYTDGDVDNGAVPVGQSCGLIDSIIDVDEIISGYTKKAEDLLKKLSSKIS